MKHTVYRSGDMILDLVIKVSYKSFTLPQNFTIVALTATATAEVQQDIMSKLSIGQNDVVKTSTKRRNLIFKVNPTYQRQNLLWIMLQIMKDRQESFIVPLVSR